MKIRLPPTSLLFLLAALGTPATAGAQSIKPVFQLNYPQPTGDKPQSKMWFSRGTWWALLPTTRGQSLWERNGAGWREHPETTQALLGLRGRCDVWPGTDGVTAVTTDRRVIKVFRLTSRQAWEADSQATLSLPEGKSGTMTATIARDGGGLWWVAADVGGHVYVWHSTNAVAWSSPLMVAGPIKINEDLCLMTPLPGGVGVIWSDQLKERVVIREHEDGTPPEAWRPETVIEAGPGTVDNHLKAALATDGTLWLATKNSVDTVGLPQLVLRVRSPDGTWRNHPYANRGSDREPSRPAVYATPNPDEMLLGHNIYNRADPFRCSIEFGRANLNAPGVLQDIQTVIFPQRHVNSKYVRNITGPKMPFPDNAPWIVLAADAAGNVFEADLKPLSRAP